jgi:hypothetical protein
MLTSVLIGQRRIEKTMILSFWPCGPVAVSAMVAALPFHFAGIQKRAVTGAPSPHDIADRMSRKQLLAVLDAQKFPVTTEIWFLLHKDPVAPTATVGHQPGGFVVHLQDGTMNIFLPPRRSFVEKVVAAMIACGDTLREDDAQKTAQLVSKIGKLRGNETIAVFWHDKNLFVKNIRRDDLDNRSLSSIAPLATR